MRPRFSRHSNAPWRFHFSVSICLHSSAVDGSDACVWTPLTTAHVIHLQQQLFMRRRGGCGVAVLALARLFRPSLALARLFRPLRPNSHQGPTDNRRVSFHPLSPSGGLYRWDCALHRMRLVHAVRTRVALSGRLANISKVFLANHDTRYYDRIYDLLVG
jgi:hypothetical protein